MAYSYNNKRIYDPQFQNDPNRVDAQLDVVDDTTDAMKGIYAPTYRYGIPMKGYFGLTDNSITQVPTAIGMSVTNYMWTADQGPYYNDHAFYAYGRDIITDVTWTDETGLLVGVGLASLEPNSAQGIDITKMGEWTHRITGAFVAGADLALTVPNHGFPEGLSGGALIMSTLAGIEDLNYTGTSFTVENSNTLILADAAALLGDKFDANGPMEGQYIFYNQAIQNIWADLQTKRLYLTYHIGNPNGRPVLGNVND